MQFSKSDIQFWMKMCFIIGQRFYILYENAWNFSTMIHQELVFTTRFHMKVLVKSQFHHKRLLENLFQKENKQKSYLILTKKTSS